MISANASEQGDAELWRDLCEKDDRTSPWADMCLVNQEEFYGYLAQARAALSPPIASAQSAYARGLEDENARLRAAWKIAEPHLPELKYRQALAALRELRDTATDICARVELGGQQPELLPNFWRPIGSAPKDGTLFVALSQDKSGCSLSPFVSLCSWHPDAGFCTDELREPTHWMAVPNLSPPSAEQNAPVVGSPDTWRG